MAMKRTALKTLGIVFLLFMLACATVQVVLAGIMYRFTNPGFIQSAWTAVSALEVASIVTAWFVGLVGFVAFLYPKTWILIAFEVLLFLSLLFSLAIGIYTIIAGSISYPNVQYGCNARITGLLDVFQYMDTYLINVDRALCSTECPCRIDNTAEFSLNPNTTSAYNTWSVSTEKFAATAFQNCSGAVQSNVLTATINQNPLFPYETFDPVEFANYMARVERSFYCTGWCNVVYVTPQSTTPITFSKYLFSNINRGPPSYVGCISILMHWIPGYLLAWGSTALVMVGIMLILFALAVMLMRSTKKEGHDVVHHERIEVVERA